MNRYLMRGAIAAMTGVVTVVAGMPMCALASTTLEQRKKALVSAGIIENFDVSLNAVTVSRAEFAKMLVHASSYATNVAAESNVSVFSDVLQSSPYAGYIRIATSKGWMSAYLGGNFKPEQGIKLAEAEKAMLTLLGYTSDQFSGNIVANRNAKAIAIGLTDRVSTNVNDELTYEDCVYMFYNLLMANTAQNDGKTKSSQTIYGSLFGFTLSDSNELNLLDTLSANLNGPHVLKSGKSLNSILPFSKSVASCYLNGETSSVEAIEDEATSCAVVVYYNSSTKSVYAYSESGNADSTMGTATGTVDQIYYSSSQIMTPTQVEIGGETYNINNSDMQYAFSIYGSIDTSDEITIVWDLDQSGAKEVIAIA